jgi:hypothetical protein
MTQRKEHSWNEWDYENRRTPAWVMMLTSAFVSFVSCLDACLDAVGVRPPLHRIRKEHETQAEGFCGFPQYLQEHFYIILEISSRALPYMSFPNHWSPCCSTLHNLSYHHYKRRINRMKYCRCYDYLKSENVRARIFNYLIYSVTQIVFPDTLHLSLHSA